MNKAPSRRDAARIQRAVDAMFVSPALQRGESDSKMTASPAGTALFFESSERSFFLATEG
jgi:hypothetical protein